MTRFERFHYESRQKSFKGQFLILLAGVFLLSFLFVFYYFSQSTIKIDEPKEELGQKVVVSMPNGHKLYTYENLIVEKNGKTFYKGERNTIDLTGGTIAYKDWK